MKLLSLVVLLNFSSAKVVQSFLKLSCDCDRLTLCTTNGIIKQAINNETLVVIESCKGLQTSDVFELQILWARKGITRSFQEFKKLKVLKVSHSFLTKLKPEFLGGLEALKKLVLDGNKIAELPQLPELMNLEKLFLAKNNIKMIKKKTLWNLKNLKVLKLEENEIFSINADAFAENQNLEELNLNRNDLSFLSPKVFQNNRKLREIALNYNKLKTLHSDIFVKTENLEVLRFHANKLQSLDKNVFTSNKLLRWIELGENRLTFLSSKLFENLKNLEFVDLADNDCIEGSFPIEMNFEHLLKLADRNCHYLAAYYFEFI